MKVELNNEGQVMIDGRLAGSFVDAVLNNSGANGAPNLRRELDAALKAWVLNHHDKANQHVLAEALKIDERHARLQAQHTGECEELRKRIKSLEEHPAMKDWKSRDVRRAAKKRLAEQMKELQAQHDGINAD